MLRMMVARTLCGKLHIRQYVLQLYRGLATLYESKTKIVWCSQMQEEFGANTTYLLRDWYTKPTRNYMGIKILLFGCVPVCQPRTIFSFLATRALPRDGGTCCIIMQSVPFLHLTVSFLQPSTISFFFSFTFNLVALSHSLGLRFVLLVLGLSFNWCL
ncbi:hypothetical protein VNO80_22727 [Phaseolus coccineus]|uniref:Uncharacterized protein n=1 Tax=Phaseolus coccineus TaxID=3886 RepID=A0AAN9M5F5_PHACN